MKKAYPVIFTPAKEGGFTSYVPDFDINSQGEDMADAIENTRDAIGIIGIDREDDGKLLPEPSEIVQQKDGSIVSFVDIDFKEYRKLNDIRPVRINISIPLWLKEVAEKAGLNISEVLQNAIKKELGIEKKVR